MKMIGMSVRSLAMRFCRSRPLRPGRETSSMRQLGTRTRGRLRNSCADANISGSQPSKRINNSSDSRTETSSSTTNTIGVPSDMGDDHTSWPSARAKFILYPPSAATSLPSSTPVRSDSRWPSRPISCPSPTTFWTTFPSTKTGAEVEPSTETLIPPMVPLQVPLPVPHKHLKSKEEPDEHHQQCVRGEKHLVAGTDPIFCV